MGKQIEMTGKTVDKAVFDGLQEIGLSIDEVEIEILERGTSGLLGIGAKPARVRLTEKENQGVDVRGLFETDNNEVKRETQDSESNTERRNEHREHRHERMETAACEHTPVRDNIEEAVFENTEHECDIQYSKELAEQNEAAKFLSEMLRLMDVEADVLAAETDETLKLRIDSESAGVLIGHRGETLDAMQYLTLLVANRDRGQKSYTRVSIDTQGYREKREEVLSRLARSKASTVRATGRPYKFEPMSPYERRIIHSTLQANSHVTTHSEGNEPYRYVVITALHGQRRRPPRSRHNVRVSDDAE